MEYVLLGWPPDGPTLRLDHEQFSYAGKFVMSSTGKAVARETLEAPAEHSVEDTEPRAIVAAVAFNEDRTDESTLWLRYVTVRADRRSEGIGPQLCAAVRAHALEAGYDRVRIAVNNPYAFHALCRAGFGPTGESTGIAERVLEAPPPGTATYSEDIALYLDRDDLSDDERTFVHRHRDKGMPDPIEPPSLVDESGV